MQISTDTGIINNISWNHFYLWATISSNDEGVIVVVNQVIRKCAKPAGLTMLLHVRIIQQQKIDYKMKYYLKCMIFVKQLLSDHQISSCGIS